MKKYIGPNGERMVSVRRDEIPPISEERLTEIEAMGDEDIDFSDIPDMSDNDEYWEKGVVRWPEKKEHITIRLDAWVIDYFKRKGGSSGRGYQSRINEALRSFVIGQLMKEAEEKGRAEGRTLRKKMEPSLMTRNKQDKSE